MIIEQVQQLTFQRIEQAQAVARPARMRFHVDVSGSGEARSKIGFGTKVLEEPTFVSGCVARGKLPVGFSPIVSTMVIKYLTDNRKMFVGAEMAFRVDGGPPNGKYTFNLIFEGVALRALNSALR